MKEKIAPLLIILVVIFAFVLLLRTPARTPAETAPPATEETVPETAPAEDALSMVEDILERHPLDKTALSHSIYDETLHSGEELTGSGKPTGFKVFLAELDAAHKEAAAEFKRIHGAMDIANQEYERAQKDTAAPPYMRSI